MLSSSTGHAVEDVYRGVISDVISQVREAFLDENVDLEVLHQLKKSWEDKVNETCSVDLNPPKTVQPPAIRQIPPRLAAALDAGPPQLVLQTGAGANASFMPVTNTGQRVVMLSAESARLLQQQSSGSNASQQEQQQQLIYAPVPTRPRMVMKSDPEQHFVHQLDGQSSFVPLNGISSTARNDKNLEIPGRRVSSPAVNPLSSNRNNVNNTKKDKNTGYESNSSTKKSKPIVTKKSKPMVIPQLDGGGAGMSEPSSESEIDDDENPLDRFATYEGADKGEEEAAEEEPLNSDDDQSDDEDIQTLFESENVVVCQFEKVQRIRNKWKFTLKDGIMHLRGKDYCFQKALGEAEW